MKNRLDHTTRVLHWWSSLPECERRAWYLPSELAALVGIASAHLELPAVLAGWSRVERRVPPGRRVRLYVPPGRAAEAADGTAVPYFVVGRDAVLARLQGLPPGMAFFGGPPLIRVLDRRPL